MPSPLFNMTMNEMTNEAGHFYAHPAVVSWDDLLDHLEKLSGLEITGIVSDDADETWVDLTYRSCEFSIDEQNGGFRFFSENLNCPKSVLLEIAEHCGKLPAEEVKEVGKAEEVAEIAETEETK